MAEAENSAYTRTMDLVAVKRYYERLLVGARSRQQLKEYWESMHRDSRLLESQVDYLDGVYNTMYRIAPLKQFCEQIKDNPTIINATLMAAVNECEI